jgi:hypothetical protein
VQADVERFLARLMTERELRDRFLADAIEVAKQEGLSAEEADAVARIPIADLLTAARSYDHKRGAKPQRARWWLPKWLRIG